MMIKLVLYININVHKLHWLFSSESSVTPLILIKLNIILKHILFWIWNVLSTFMHLYNRNYLAYIAYLTCLPGVNNGDVKYTVDK